METNIETVRGVLAAMKFTPERIEAALSALQRERAPSEPRQDEPLMTPKELCAALKISLTSLWRLRPPCLVVGARKRFDLHEVREFLASRTKGVA